MSAADAYAAVLGRRIKLLAEILSTEKTYVAALHTLLHSFIRPLESHYLHTTARMPGGLSVVFSNVEQLYVIHTQLLRDLTEHVAQEESAHGAGVRDKIHQQPFSHGSVAAIFMKFAGLFALYAQYGANYSTALQLVDECSHDDDGFAAVVAEAEAAPACAGTPLSSFLITPIQRVPRYLLLLNELLRQTPGEPKQPCACLVCDCGKAPSPSCRYRREAVSIREAIVSVDAAAKVRYIFHLPQKLCAFAFSQPPPPASKHCAHH